MARQAAGAEQRQVRRLRARDLGPLRPRPLPDAVQAEEDEPEEPQGGLLQDRGRPEDDAVVAAREHPAHALTELRVADCRVLRIQCKKKWQVLFQNAG